MASVRASPSPLLKLSRTSKPLPAWQELSWRQIAPFPPQPFLAIFCCRFFFAEFSHAASTRSAVQIHLQKPLTLLLFPAGHRRPLRRLDPLLPLGGEPLHRTSRQAGANPNNSKRTALPSNSWEAKNSPFRPFTPTPAPFAAANPCNSVTAWPTPKPSHWSRSPIPSGYSRCVDVTPTKTTTYTLTITDTAGHTKTQTLEVHVH